MTEHWHLLCSCLLSSKILVAFHCIWQVTGCLMSAWESELRTRRNGAGSQSSWRVFGLHRASGDGLFCCQLLSARCTILTKTPACTYSLKFLQRCVRAGLALPWICRLEVELLQVGDCFRGKSDDKLSRSQPAQWSQGGCRSQSLHMSQIYHNSAPMAVS